MSQSNNLFFINLLNFLKLTLLTTNESLSDIIVHFIVFY